MADALAGLAPELFAAAILQRVLLGGDEVAVERARSGSRRCDRSATRRGVLRQELAEQRRHAPAVEDRLAQRQLESILGADVHSHAPHGCGAPVEPPPLLFVGPRADVTVLIFARE